MRYVILLLISLFAQPLLSQDSFPVDEDGAQFSEAFENENTHVLVAPEELETTRLYRGEDFRHRRFDSAKWKVVVGEEEFIEQPGRKKNVGRREDISIPWAGPVLKTVSYIIIICVVGFLLYYVTKNITFGSRIERSEVRNDDLAKPVENIAELDIEALLEQARREGNFKLAVRLYYLGLLKKMNALGLITWKKDKTNRDYLSELFARDLYYKEMQKLTFSYEAVWYGEHTLEGESFQRLTDQFEAVYREINTVQGHE